MQIQTNKIQKTLTAAICLVAVTLCVILAANAAKRKDVDDTQTETTMYSQIILSEPTLEETQTELPTTQTTAQAVSQAVQPETTPTMPTEQTTAKAPAKEAKPQAANPQQDIKPQPAKAAAPAPTAAPAVKHDLILNKGTGIATVHGGGSYAAGTRVTVSCTLRDGYTFREWTSGLLGFRTNNAMTFTFTMPDSMLLLTAEADSIYTNVTVRAGTGISAVYGGGQYLPGDRVTVSCTVNTGYAFTGWSSSNTSYVASSGAPRYTFTVPRQNVTLTANAEKTTYTVRLNADSGIQSVSGAGGYKPGDRVTVSCTVKTGYTFTNWSSSNTAYVAGSSTQQYSFTVPKQDVTLTAHAVKTTYTVRLRSDSGILSVSGAGAYKPGDTVTVTCTVRSGYKFTNWTTDSRTVPDSTTKRYTFTMPEGNVTLTANSEYVETTGTTVPAPTEPTQTHEQVTVPEAEEPTATTTMPLPMAAEDPEEEVI